VIRYHISIIFLILAACILQQFLPAITGFYDARIHIFALTFLCCAVTIGFSPMLLIAFVCGFIWDAQNAVGPHGGDPTVYKEPVEHLRFGYSIILLVEYLLINTIRGNLYFPTPVLYHMLWSSLLTMLISPIIFFILFKLAKWTHFTIRFDGLKRRGLRLSTMPSQ